MIFKKISKLYRKKYTEKSKTGFVDLHCHILPGVDDGAKDMPQALHMLRLAYEEGIRSIIVTPHHREKVFETSIEILSEKLSQLKESVGKELKDLTLALGSEIYYSHESTRLLSEGIIATLGESRYILVEFSPFAEYKYIKNGLQDIILSGYRPILAHVERYENLMSDLARIKDLTDMGVCHQINAGGILGSYGREQKKRCKKLLKNHLVHLAATDAHSDTDRAPVVKKSFFYIVKKYGAEYGEALFIHNPEKILEGKYLI